MQYNHGQVVMQTTVPKANNFILYFKKPRGNYVWKLKTNKNQQLSSGSLINFHKNGWSYKKIPHQ